ncbi:hypothetical protein PVK06_026772 [Gossypium arboreum]|uniref:Uncharacterized protein n=1 Tax=Gossypium arboreum TaxID=29729 RepID=A0ABR0NYK1_GOSAR|nr:hypothetical protein PVK06_026772 [Gossypium arboreum]
MVFYLLTNILSLAYDPEYVSWFSIHGKPYLYGEEARRQHPHTSRPQQPHLNPRAGIDRESTRYPIGVWDSTCYAHSSFVTQTPLGSFLYQGGSSSQLSIPKPDNARWQPRMQGSQSTKGKEEEKPIPQPQQPQPRSKAKPRRNPVYNRRPPCCGTGSNGTCIA